MTASDHGRPDGLGLGSPYEVLEFIGAHPIATPSQVAALLGIDQRDAEGRVAELEAARLVRRIRVFRGESAAVRISPAGLRMVGYEPPLPIRERDYEHDIGVGWLWLKARQGTFGPGSFLSSSQMIQADRQAGPAGSAATAAAREASGTRAAPFGVPVPRPGEPDCQHYPDLVVEHPRGRIAIELELGPGPPRELPTILGAYGASSSVGALLYFVRHALQGRAILGAAATVGLSSLVHVQLVAPERPHR